jgi:hypothetical protein
VVLLLARMPGGVRPGSESLRRLDAGVRSRFADGCERRSHQPPPPRQRSVHRCPTNVRGRSALHRRPRQASPPQTPGLRRPAPLILQRHVSLYVAQAPDGQGHRDNFEELVSPVRASCGMPPVHAGGHSLRV